MESLSNLEEVNVSYHLVVHMQGTSQSFGTPNATKVYEENEETFRKALVDDAINLCGAALERDDEEVASEKNYKDIAKEKAFQLKHGKEFQRLPFPLSLMNRKEKVACIRYLISYDKRQRKVSGDDSAEPRFWPNHIVKWSSLKVNIGVAKSEHLNGESPTSFMAKVIESAFEIFDKDPETFYEEKVTTKMMKKRKRMFGIHEPSTTHHQEEDPQEQEDTNVCDSESNKNTTYTVGGEGDTENENNVDEDELVYDFPPGTENSFPSEKPNATVPNTVFTEARVQRDSLDSVSQVRMEEIEPQEDNDNPIYFDLPANLQQIAPAKKGRYNCGKGFCLALAIAQQEGFDPKKLKMYANKKMVEWYIHVKKFMTYPLSITVGSGNDSYQKPIAHQYELFSFLRSEESLYAWNTGDAEIAILATVINQPIHLVIYNMQGLPSGTPFLDRCRIQTIHPIEHIKKKSNKFVMKEDVFLLYEDAVHFSLLVNKDEGLQIPNPIGSGGIEVEEDPPHVNTEASAPEEDGISVGTVGLGADEVPHGVSVRDQEEVPSPATSAEIEEIMRQNLASDQHGFIDDLYYSMFPGEIAPSSEEDFAEVLNATQAQQNDDTNKEVSGQRSATSPCSGDFTPTRTSSKRKASENNIVRGLSKNQDVLASTLRRSNRILEKNNTLDKLLKLPSHSVREKEQKEEEYYAYKEKKRLQRKRKHDDEMAKLDANMERFKKQKEVEQKETEELIQLADVLRKELTEEKIEKIMAKNLEYFEDVKTGLEKNWRHKLYVSPGNSDPKLRSSMVGAPFTDLQQDIIFEQVKNIWLKDKDMDRENRHYVDFVLLPTVFIRIYQVFMELTSFEEAERRINNAKASLYHESPDSITEML